MTRFWLFDFRFLRPRPQCVLSLGRRHVFPRWTPEVIGLYTGDRVHDVEVRRRSFDTGLPFKGVVPRGCPSHRPRGLCVVPCTVRRLSESSYGVPGVVYSVSCGTNGHGPFQVHVLVGFVSVLRLTVRFTLSRTRQRLTFPEPLRLVEDSPCGNLRRDTDRTINGRTGGTRVGGWEDIGCGSRR